MKVLVTGAGGYVGIPLLRRLVEAGHEVTALDRYFFGVEKLGALAENPLITILTADIRSFDPAVIDGHEAVIDLAGLSNDASAEIDPDLTRQINHAGGERMAKLAKARGVRRYVYASSASVYGHGLKTALVETDECRPQTLYAESKVHVEGVLNRLKGDGFEPVIFRNATIFGLAPRMRFDLAVNIMTLRAMKERVIYVMGGGEQWRPFVHVNDVVTTIMLGLESDAKLVAGETFNVGDENLNYQIRDIAQFVLDAVPNTVVHVIPDDPDKRTYNLSFDKIRRVLGFTPKTTIAEGVREIRHAIERGLVGGEDPTTYTLQWYKALLEWEKRVKALSLDGRIL